MPTYTDAQFALMMAIELKKLQQSADSMTAAKQYYEFLVTRPGAK